MSTIEREVFGAWILLIAAVEYFAYERVEVFLTINCYEVDNKGLKLACGLVKFMQFNVVCDMLYFGAKD